MLQCRNEIHSMNLTDYFILDKVPLNNQHLRASLEDILTLIAQLTVIWLVSYLRSRGITLGGAEFYSWT